MRLRLPVLSRRSQGISVGVLAALEALIVFLMLWHPVIERTLSRDLIQHDGEFLYTVATPRLPGMWGYRWIGNGPVAARRSTLVLLEDGVPLGPAHTPADRIRPYGKGSFNHWDDILFFSASDNSDPRVSPHVYVARGPAAPRGILLRVLVGLSIVIGGLLGWTGAGFVRAGLARMSRTQDAGATPLLSLAVTGLKIAALGLIGILGPMMWIPFSWNEAITIGLSGRTGFLALYLCVVALSLVGLIVAPFVRDWRVRTALCTILILGFCADQVMRGISGQPMTLEMMNMLWRERAMSGEVLPFYFSAIWPNLLLAGALALALLLPPAGRMSAPRRLAAIPATALLAVGFIVFSTNGRSEAYPSPYAVPAQAIAQFFFERGGNVERQPVEYELPLRSDFKKIVVVIDESVRGDYLGLNNPKYDNTPFLNSSADKIANYGVAISGANCSVSSRMMMRVGLQKEQLPDVAQLYRRLPTLWQYAHAAGYKAVFIDAFHPFSGYHSYMDAKEAAQIDEFRPTSAKGMMYNQDMQIAQMLLQALASDQKSLIYVNKVGAHNSYASRYPPDLDYDSTPLVEHLTNLDAEQRESVAAYHRAIRWSVDGFFARILPHIGSDTLLIYTSDHGQSLYEGGYVQSHCTPRHDLALGEVYVPMFVISGNAAVQQRFSDEAKRAYNRASHFEIFSTVLESMGYASGWVERRYGPGLLDVPVERRRGFLLGLLFLSGSTWVDVDKPANTSSVVSR